jgi:hypothetical protein
LSAGVEEKRLVVEIIATLVNIKHTMAELILKPAVVPSEVYRPVFQQPDEQTGQLLSKRKWLP